MVSAVWRQVTAVIYANFRAIDVVYAVYLKLSYEDSLDLQNSGWISFDILPDLRAFL